MAESLLKDINTYLFSKGIIEGDGVDAFRDFTPEEPDNIVVLHEYKGSPVPFYENDAANRSVQFNVRNTDPDVARQQCVAIYESLKSLTSYVQLTEERWCQVNMRQTPFKLSEDDHGRVTYCFNAGITTTIY